MKRMSDLFKSRSQGPDVSVELVMASPALRDIVAEAGLNVGDLAAGQLRVWLCLKNEG
jgi:hypothetical protein